MANIINVGSGKKRHIARTILVSVVTVALLVGGGYVAFVMKPWIQKTSQQKPSKYSYNSVVGQVNGANYTQAIAQLNTQASTAKDDGTKLFAYYQQCSLALNAQKYDDALHYAQLADGIQSSSETSRLIALSYAGKGDKQHAIEYYKKAISQSDSNTQLGQIDIRDYQKAIAELGS